MWDKVRIIDSKHFVAVYDGDERIHYGTRPIDRVFVANVRKQMAAMGYNPQESNGETRFSR